MQGFSYSRAISPTHVDAFMDTISPGAEDLHNLMQCQCINQLEVTAVPMSLQSTESGITVTNAKQGKHHA